MTVAVSGRPMTVKKVTSPTILPVHYRIHLLGSLWSRQLVLWSFPALPWQSRTRYTSALEHPPAQVTHKTAPTSAHLKRLSQRQWKEKNDRGGWGNSQKVEINTFLDMGIVIHERNHMEMCKTELNQCQAWIATNDYTERERKLSNNNLVFT